MRGVMMFFNTKTVTLFNRYYNAGTELERYYMTVFDRADLVVNRKTAVSKDGKEKADAVTLYVDYADLPKPYLDPKEWAALPEEKKDKYFTFTPAEDFFIKGDCTRSNLPETELYDWARKNMDHVYKVVSINRYEDILPHFEVGGV